MWVADDEGKRKKKQRSMEKNGMASRETNDVKATRYGLQSVLTQSHLGKRTDTNNEHRSRRFGLTLRVPIWCPSETNS